MPHVDEGTLNALLDGELDAAEVRAIDEHVAACAACAARLDEVRLLLGEANRLVGALQVEAPLGGAAGGAGPAAAPPPHTPEPEPEPVPPADEWAVPRPATDPVARPIEPVVLLPTAEPRIATRRRVGLPGWARWAAMLFVTVGAGALALAVRQPDAPAVPIAPIEPTTDYTLSPEEATIASESVSLGDTSGESATAGFAPRDQAAAGAAAQKAQTPPAAAARARDTAAVASRPTATPRAERVERERAPASDRQEAGAAPLAAVAADSGDVRTDTAEAERELADRSRRETQAEIERLQRERTAQARRESVEVDRRRAAAAMATLDLDKRRAAEERARMLDTADAAADAPPPAAPARPTVAERAGTYLRIGLDEAARQLGSPLHVIEGMRHEFVGLALGRLSPGADTSRPVVRAVYLDYSGRLILLDQQRIRRLPDGSTRPATENLGPTQVVRGDVWISVRGEVPPAQLESYARRVR